MRDSKIDIIKGLGIILMVMGHACCPFSSFFFLFHMAIFFIASGYLYKGVANNSISDAKSYIFKKIKSLYIPYILCNTIYTLCHNLFVSLHIYDKDYLSIKEIAIRIAKGLLLGSGTEMGGALWFVAVLFVITITFYLFDFLISKSKLSVPVLRNTLQGLISIITLITGFFCQRKSTEILGSSILTISFSCYSLFFLGTVIKGIIKNTSLKTYVTVIIIVVSSIAIYILSKNGIVALNSNLYTDPFYLIISSVLGWAWIYSISSLVSKTNVLKKRISYLGQNTMPILILHFLSFKVVSLLGILLKEDSINNLASFPTLYNDGWWWIGYSFVGIMIPLVLSQVYSFIINRIKKHANNHWEG